jgi:hypothetical protein
MPKTNLLTSIGIPVATGLAGIAGGAAAGSELQKRKLIKAFNAYNQQENSAIAQNFYEQGAMDVMGKKAAYIEQIKMAAFTDELEKLSGIGSGIGGAISSGARGLWSSTKALGKGLGGAMGIGGKANANTIGSNLRRGLPAAGVIGAGAVGGSFMAGRASKPSYNQ